MPTWYKYDRGTKTDKYNINRAASLEDSLKHEALPSDDSVLQIVELDELPKATGVVILCGLSVAKGLFKTQRT